MPKSDLFGASSPGESEECIEVWNDLVSPRDLTWSLIACGGSVALALGIATLLSSNLFMWGLGGAVAGFVLCTLVFKPKRVVEIVDGEDLAAVPGSVNKSGPVDAPEYSAQTTQGDAR